MKIATRRAGVFLLTFIIAALSLQVAEAQVTPIKFAVLRGTGTRTTAIPVGHDSHAVSFAVSADITAISVDVSAGARGPSGALTAIGTSTLLTGATITWDGNYNYLLVAVTASGASATSAIDITYNGAPGLASTVAGVNQGSTTSGQSGSLVLCAATTDEPVYANGTTNPINCGPDGRARVDAPALRHLTTPPTCVNGEECEVTTDPGGYLRMANKATASGGTSGCNVLSTASTNAVNCATAAAGLYGFDLENITTTIYYLRLYNLATTPTCSSATGFVRSIPIPPASAAGQVGGIVVTLDTPNTGSFTAGLGYCLTAGSASTDNTNAAVGIFGQIRFKQ